MCGSVQPVSAKSLQDRLLSVLTKPRPVVQKGNYYGPMPRKMVAVHADGDEAVANLVLVN